MFLLRLDRWKLFLLLFAPAILSVVVLLFGDSLFHAHAITLILSELFKLVFIGVFVYWIYAIGTHLARLEPNQHRRLSLFIVALAFALVYRVLVDLYTLTYSIANGGDFDLENQLWIVPFHLLATVAAFYCFYVDAQLLVSAERQQPGDFRHVWKTFLLVALFPIGLWFTQPRLQKQLHYN